MSLKAFHVLFITLSILITLLFGIWCALSFREYQKGIYLAGSVFSFAFSGALIVYGLWFLRKIRNIEKK